MASQIISYTDFRKGLNDTVSPDNMQDNELQKAVNIDLSVRGGFSTRKGTSKINADNLGHECTQLIPWLYKDEERLLAVVNKELNIVNSDGSLTVKQALQSDEVGTFAIKNKLYFGDGDNIYTIDDDVVEPLSETDGETLAKHRLVITFHAQEAGDIKVTAGGVEKTITLVKDESRTSIATKIANQTWTGWTVTRDAFEVTFEAETPGDKKLYYDPQLTGAWADVYTEKRGVSADNIFDDFKKCTMFVFHVNSMRIFGSGNANDPTAVYYSEPGDPTMVKSTSIMYPASAEGKVTGMLQFMQSVLVSYNYSWWQFAGHDPEGEFGAPDATWTKLPIPHGCVGPDAVVLTPQSFTFLSRDGLHAVSTNLLSQTFIAIESKDLVRNLTGEKVDSIMKNIKKHHIARLAYHDNKLYLAYCDDINLDNNNRVLVYDWRTDGFVKYEGWKVNDWARHKSELAFGSKNWILQHNKLRNADVNVETGEDQAIHILFETKGYNLDSDVNSKFLNLLHVIFSRFPEENTSAKLTLISDYSVIYDELELSEVIYDSTLIWTRMWGNKWGASEIIQRQVEIKKIGHRFSVRIENEDMNEPITMYGLGFQFKKIKSRAERMTIGGLLE